MTVNTYGFGHVQKVTQWHWLDHHLWYGHLVQSRVTSFFMRAGVQFNYQMWGLR